MEWNFGKEIYALQRWERGGRLRIFGNSAERTAEEKRNEQEQAVAQSRNELKTNR